MTSDVGGIQNVAQRALYFKLEEEALKQVPGLIKSVIMMPIYAIARMIYGIEYGLYNKGFTESVNYIHARLKDVKTLSELQGVLEMGNKPFFSSIKLNINGATVNVSPHAYNMAIRSMANTLVSNMVVSDQECQQLDINDMKTGSHLWGFDIEQIYQWMQKKHDRLSGVSDYDYNSKSQTLKHAFAHGFNNVGKFKIIDPHVRLSLEDSIQFIKLVSEFCVSQEKAQVFAAGRTSSHNVYNRSMNGLNKLGLDIGKISNYETFHMRNAGLEHAVNVLASSKATTESKKYLGQLQRVVHSIRNCSKSGSVCHVFSETFNEKTVNFNGKQHSAIFFFGRRAFSDSRAGTCVDQSFDENCVEAQKNNEFVMILDKIYEKRDEGHWVSLSNNDKGRIFVFDNDTFKIKRSDVVKLRPENLSNENKKKLQQAISYKPLGAQNFTGFMQGLREVLSENGNLKLANKFLEMNLKTQLKDILQTLNATNNVNNDMKDDIKTESSLLDDFIIRGIDFEKGILVESIEDRKKDALSVVFHTIDGIKYRLLVDTEGNIDVVNCNNSIACNFNNQQALKITNKHGEELLLESDYSGEFNVVHATQIKSEYPGVFMLVNPTKDKDLNYVSPWIVQRYITNDISKRKDILVAPNGSEINMTYNNSHNPLSNDVTVVHPAVETNVEKDPGGEHVTYNVYRNPSGSEVVNKSINDFVVTSTTTKKSMDKIEFGINERLFIDVDLTKDGVSNRFKVAINHGDVIKAFGEMCNQKLSQKDLQELDISKRDKMIISDGKNIHLFCMLASLGKAIALPDFKVNVPIVDENNNLSTKDRDKVSLSFSELLYADMYVQIQSMSKNILEFEKAYGSVIGVIQRNYEKLFTHFSENGLVRKSIDINKLKLSNLVRVYSDNIHKGLDINDENIVNVILKRSKDLDDNNAKNIGKEIIVLLNKIKEQEQVLNLGKIELERLGLVRFQIEATMKVIRETFKSQFPDLAKNIENNDELRTQKIKELYHICQADPQHTIMLALLIDATRQTKIEVF